MIMMMSSVKPLIYKQNLTKFYSFLMRYSEGCNTLLLQGGASELPAVDGEPPGEREPQPGVHRQPQRPQQQHLLQGRKVTGGWWGGVMACRIIVSAPVPFLFLWTLDF